MKKEEIEIFYPTSLTAWRKWLTKNHLSKQAVWLVFYKKASGKKSLTWSESVDVALCFGWIDSKKIKIDEITSHQYFSKRKSKSTWSKINKEKVQRLIENGQMMAPGYKSIKTAKQNGSWTILDQVEELIIPKDLELAFKKQSGSKDFFRSLSKSARKALLIRLVLAKRPETRQKRIEEIFKLAGQSQKFISFGKNKNF
ncbi:YdeI/OmpD-associated family protein [Salegentibacter sp. F188]|uniref:YdeI/OmpD-associated family protein n=1 Tax=Autumnicola patrickiae TaxID=3075591 RepID=A0ABU3E1N5_9FLAO|nr:YdeI/OmpD-associated family protein [Salegentibacter sp. F188]MDT0689904.1 YdeI/OmpD-associated family protein [Salegentibacter sp. F188]